MTTETIKKAMLISVICFYTLSFKGYAQKQISIYFSEYDLTILEIPKLGDTLKYNKSNKEDFKFIFYNKKGKCYCERYINKKLYEKGCYESSIDTLKRYIYGHNWKGKSSPIKIKKYFEPLKNGEWILYKDGKRTKEVYTMGILNR